MDTSAIGGVSDDEFAEASQRFFERVRRGEFTVLVSSTCLAELQGAPASVSELLPGLPEDAVVELEESEEVSRLAKAYLDAGVLGASSFADATHVASATAGGADLILSWNFRHMVNYERIRKFNSVNLAEGYDQIDIRRPVGGGVWRRSRRALTASR